MAFEGQNVSRPWPLWPLQFLRHCHPLCGKYIHSYVCAMPEAVTLAPKPPIAYSLSLVVSYTSIAGYHISRTIVICKANQLPVTNKISKPLPG